jgi:hypothetical protein
MQLEKLVERIDRITHEEILRTLGGTFPGKDRIQPARAVAVQRRPVDVGNIAWLNGAYHAMSIADVQILVSAARETNRKLRVAGSQHSAHEAVFSPNEDDIRVVLDGKLRAVELISQDESGAVVRVGGGCYLGKNPSDPSATWANSLNAQLEALGVSLPSLGGITHQTVAGFMQTSSSGGSLNHGFADAVLAIEWVDGLSRVQTFEVGSPEFYAVGVALGLFGVITRVSLRCKPRYFVAGTEINYELKNSFLAKQDGRYPLEDALTQNDFMHLNWFPQRNVQRVMQWVGQKVDSMEPFKPYDSELRNEWMNLLAAVVLRIGNILDHTDPNNALVALLIGKLLQPFVPLDHNKDFHDFWYRALPSDDEVDVERLITIQFTEIWLPIPQLTTALDRLFHAIGNEQRMAGNFAVELYGAKVSPFWMSPSNGRDVVRVDVFWWGHNFGDPRHFFTYYWDTLLDLTGARLHWGKFLPAVGQKCGNVTFGADFIRNAYADHIDDWLGLRQAFDPQSVFLTDYWRLIFGL